MVRHRGEKHEQSCSTMRARKQGRAGEEEILGGGRGWEHVHPSNTGVQGCTFSNYTSSPIFYKSYHVAFEGHFKPKA